MKAITLYQPTAALVALGIQPIVAMSLPAPSTLVGRELAIHAHRRTPPLWREAVMRRPIVQQLLLEYAELMHVAELDGMVIGTAVLASCHHGRVMLKNFPGDSLERLLANATGSSWCWRLTNACLMTPVKARGSDLLWDFEPLHTVAGGDARC